MNKVLLTAVLAAAASFDTAQCSRMDGFFDSLMQRMTLRE